MRTFQKHSSREVSGRPAYGIWIDMSDFTGPLSQRSPWLSASFAAELATRIWYAVCAEPRESASRFQLSRGCAASIPSGFSRYSQRNRSMLASAHAHAGVAVTTARSKATRIT